MTEQTPVLGRDPANASSTTTEPDPTTASTTRPGRIPRTEWPAIIARHEAGESASAIARAYAVTGPAIHYILKKAKSAQETAPADDVAPAAAATSVDPATTTDASDRGAEPAPADDAEPATDASEPDTRIGPPADGESFASPPAERLWRAAADCCRALEALHLIGGSGDGVMEEVHQVRRALAAIEIEMSKRLRPAPISAPGEEEIHGTVKFFNSEKGFGFVAVDDGSPDVFVSLETVERSGLSTLAPRQRVRVTTTMGSKGPQAESVELL